MPVALRILAWLALAAIIVATLGPIGLRPHTPWSPHLERFAAFFMVGALFVLAYPRRWLPVLGALIAAAGLLEVAQGLIPHRHPGLRDFLVKAAGGIGGITAGLVGDWLLSRLAILRRNPTA